MTCAGCASYWCHSNCCPPALVTAGGWRCDSCHEDTAQQPREPTTQKAYPAPPGPPREAQPQGEGDPDRWQPPIYPLLGNRVHIVPQPIHPDLDTFPTGQSTTTPITNGRTLLHTSEGLYIGSLPTPAACILHSKGITVPTIQFLLRTDLALPELERAMSTPQHLLDLIIPLEESWTDRGRSPLTLHPGFTNYSTVQDYTPHMGGLPKWNSQIWSGFSIVTPPHKPEIANRMLGWAIASAQHQNATPCLTYILLTNRPRQLTPWLEHPLVIPLGSLTADICKDRQGASHLWDPPQTKWPTYGGLLLVIGNQLGLHRFTQTHWPALCQAMQPIINRWYPGAPRPPPTDQPQITDRFRRLIPSKFHKLATPKPTRPSPAQPHTDAAPTTPTLPPHPPHPPPPPHYTTQGSLPDPPYGSHSQGGPTPQMESQRYGLHGWQRNRQGG